MWNTHGDNPNFFVDDRIGNIVGDGTTLCVKDTNNSLDFDGTCPRASALWYRCCAGNGR
jgi:hypothetical protein